MLWYRFSSDGFLVDNLLVVRPYKIKAFSRTKVVQQKWQSGLLEDDCEVFRCWVMGPLFSISLLVYNTFVTAWGLVCYKSRIQGKTKCYKMEIEHLAFATKSWLKNPDGSQPWSQSIACTPFFPHFSGGFAGQSSSHISIGEHCKMQRTTNAGWKQCIYINSWTQANCLTTFWMLALCGLKV